MATPTLADVIFSEQANHNFSKILGDLKRSNLSITNRLRSIQQDASFVQEVAETLQLPLVANERCGSWYIDPSLKTASAYFKSTDGHTSQWKFSTRRLNLHILDLIGKHDGCIIVDSTRRGKRMPDALSKTIPIWCCVLNRALFPDNPTSHTLFVPPNAVSDSEKSQMEARIPEFLDSFKSLNINLKPLKQHLQKPLRPLWITQENLISADPVQQVAQGSHPVVCCTSSRRVAGTEISEGGYIQGAGDDTENWALGLTAPIFWRHRERLLSAPEAELPELIQSLLESPDPGGEATSESINVAPHLCVGSLSALESSLASGACVLTLGSKATEPDTWMRSASRMDVGLGKSKAASRNLRQALPVVCDFVYKYVARPSEPLPDKRVVVLCETGKDLSVGVALALYCWIFDASGNIWPEGGRDEFSKTSIRVRLGQIMTTMPNANPSRATLQSVNSWLMDWRK
ncbi:putative tRNA A64-2'-O-ribosylphosphate transferase [Podospora aff. communis PSN243]|uniref:tRNA A64-2'-O-ribosylphosphate transferase n=1 Tax=Podospora aff. communis PSN243 TaxID=3040156 RepID=A0AAV9GW41_9PEZI|nr:putative tRNA A64-2'-O-ribosylphosphate transferase [Podospora aff. communis PSN243]